jgi:molybdopterin-biosynthesis enzyme MoeA-like protein
MYGGNPAVLKTMLSNYVEALLKGKDEQKENQKAESQVSIQDEEPIEDAMNAEEETFEIVDISFSMVGRSLKYLNQTQ